MADIIGVKFKSGGKVYYFAPNEDEFNIGDGAVVETARGIECGEVAIEKRTIPDDKLLFPLKPVVRKATKEDMERLEDNKKKEVTAFEICEKRIAKHGLEMKLVSVEYAFDGSKILFCFISDGRVDFRELVKDLAGIFRTRIELRQIGVRDEARMLGGLGVCGRPFCCATFLNEFQPVSIKMAKEQGLSLNPVKISGTCGRLMCCLKYEQEAYDDLIRITPRIGAFVTTPDGRGVVVDRNLISGNLRVQLDGDPDAAPKNYNLSSVKFNNRRYQQEEEEETSEIAAAEEESPELAALEENEGVQEKRNSNQHRNNRGNNHNHHNNHGNQNGGREHNAQNENKPAGEQAAQNQENTPQNKGNQGQQRNQGGRNNNHRPHRPNKPHQNKPNNAQNNSESAQ